MRTLLALITGVLVVQTAFAADPSASAASAASKPAVSKPATAIKPSSAAALTPTPSPAASPAVAKGREEIAEVELSTKIAARLAALRAQQAEKNAQASRVQKRKAKPPQSSMVTTPHGTHWAYEGEFGPRNWGKINSDWIKCSTGNRQSPIDIRNGMKVYLEQINFDYRPSGFNVIDNGHTIQVNLEGGNFLTIMGRTYELQQFHFHRPSEERVNGRSFEMVAHLVHKDAEDRLAVVAVLIERGEAHSLIQTIWNNLPLEKHETNSPAFSLDMNDILPKRRDYYTYMGSLTTPPCTEGVMWMVMKEPIQASGAQLALFSRLYPMNARPVQANSGRVIKESQ